MDRPELSVIIPFFKKFSEFQQVFPMNSAYLSDPRYEVVLVLDEPSEEGAVLELARRHPKVRWRILVNDQPHDWRNPSKPLNVGIKHALGRHVLVVSPESAFVGDVPGKALQAVQANGRAFAIGMVFFSTFDLLAEHGGDAERAFENRLMKNPTLQFFGSFCTATEHVAEIGGYDERLEKWGGDDVNLRIRLMMAGVKLVPAPDLRVLHLSTELRGARNKTAPTRTREEEVTHGIRVFRPESARANLQGWGEDFSRVALDWRREL